ncbi:MAG: peptidase [Rhodopirellula sp.]|nr:peptidase [Rhodopirellula sp.]
MINQEVKGTLAKLLATENLTVEHRKVSTAYFDVEKRVLCLPIWKSASSTVYDLLVGHEVGHALYTPSDDLKGISKPFVNVLEDARIERMMKQTYPGLRKSFFEGYQELWEDDFFGVRDMNMEDLPLIDRINLYFKGNPEVPFSDTETVWVSRASKTKTFQDVLDLASELYEYAQELQEQKDNQMDAPTPKDDVPGSPSGEDLDEVNPVSEDDPDEEGTQEETEQDWFTDDDPMEREQYGDDPAHLDVPSYDLNETESVTEKALAEALESMIDDDAKEWVYLNMPNPDLKKIIVPFNEIQENLQEHYYDKTFASEYMDDVEKKYHANNIEFSINKYQEYKKDSVKTVNYLVKQFEMKKSAAQYKRAATSKTGVIDTNKLFKYKLTDDIFKKTTVVPDGKNHGLVMFVDWSGSMADVLLDTIKQTFNLVWFCKKAGIPFRVMAFQSGAGYKNFDDGKETLNLREFDMHMHDDFKLLEFFSSKQNAKSLEKSMQLIFLHVFSMGGYRISTYSKYGLGGTPLSEAMYCTRSIVDAMKRVENITKVNVVCLTDGEANPLGYVQQSPYHDEEFRGSYLCHSRGRVYILRDTVTGYSRRMDASPYHTTKELVSFMREITDYNWIGIRICNKGDMLRIAREYSPKGVDAAEQQWKKERFATLKDNVGFSESLYMPTQGMGNSSQDLEVKQKGEVATRAELSRAFKKHMGSKMTNKTILNRFIEQIA